MSEYTDSELTLEYQQILSDCTEQLRQSILEAFNEDSKRNSEIIIVCTEVSDTLWSGVVQFMQNHGVTINWDEVNQIEENNEDGAVLGCLLPFEFCRIVLASNPNLGASFVKYPSPNMIRFIIFAHKRILTGEVCIQPNTKLN